MSEKLPTHFFLFHLTINLSKKNELKQHINCHLRYSRNFAILTPLINIYLAYPPKIIHQDARPSGSLRHILSKMFCVTFCPCTILSMYSMYMYVFNDHIGAHSCCVLPDDLGSYHSSFIPWARDHDCPRDLPRVIRMLTLTWK